MRRTVFFVIAICLCYSSMVGAYAQARKRQQPTQQKTGQVQKAAAPKVVIPALLGHGVLFIGVRYVRKMNSRPKNQVADVIWSYADKWESALSKAGVERPRHPDAEIEHVFAGSRLYIFAFGVEDLWENDQFQSKKLDRLIQRLEMLPRESLSDWKKQLQKIGVSNDQVVGLETVGYLIQLDRLFADDGFKPQESKNLLARLESLTPAAIEATKKELDLISSQAAMLLIQDDLLFSQNQFQVRVFDRELQKLKAHIEKTYPADEPQKKN